MKNLKRKLALIVAALAVMFGALSVGTPAHATYPTEGTPAGSTNATARKCVFWPATAVLGAQGIGKQGGPQGYGAPYWMTRVTSDTGNFSFIFPPWHGYLYNVASIHHDIHDAYHQSQISWVGWIGTAHPYVWRGQLQAGQAEPNHVWHWRASHGDVQDPTDHDHDHKVSIKTYFGANEVGCNYGYSGPNNW